MKPAMVSEHNMLKHCLTCQSSSQRALKCCKYQTNMELHPFTFPVIHREKPAFRSIISILSVMFKCVQPIPVKCWSNAGRIQSSPGWKALIHPQEIFGIALLPAGSSSSVSSFVAPQIVGGSMLNIHLSLRKGSPSRKLKPINRKQKPVNQKPKPVNRKLKPVSGGFDPL